MNRASAALPLAETPSHEKVTEDASSRFREAFSMAKTSSLRSEAAPREPRKLPAPTTRPTRATTNGDRAEAVSAEHREAQASKTERHAADNRQSVDAKEDPRDPVRAPHDKAAPHGPSDEAVHGRESPEAASAAPREAIETDMKKVADEALFTAFGITTLAPIAEPLPGISVDFSSLFTVMPSPVAGTQPALDASATGSRAATSNAASNAAIIGGEKALDHDLGGASASTLHSLADALARSETPAPVDGKAPAPRSTAAPISAEAQALFAQARAQSAAHASAPAPATQAAQAAQASEKEVSPSSSETSAGTPSGASSTAPKHEVSQPISAAAGGRMGTGTDAKSQGDSANEGTPRGENPARAAVIGDAFHSDQSAQAGVLAHGAFGVDTRLQNTSTGTNTEARADQMRAASERILQQVERMAEQRTSNRDMVIATERGPVRLRIEIAEKQVTVQFRTEDEQLKNLLRSGLPALQASLARNGYAQSNFNFDGNGQSDFTAGAGSQKRSEARAIRDSQLGEAMVETAGVDARTARHPDPKALLSVTA